ncbi:MAG: TetR/AcrR family transcriptional regulator, partial [Rhodobacteraceae bacterium]|nr:TetR/AcrR family transcriptional regulator [Paracoccaceae bacterium]
KKAQREARILDAALSIFRAQGFDDARMEQIAEMSELAIGTVYNYFPTKGDLLVAIVGLETSDTLAAGAAVVNDPPDDPQAAMLALAEAWYRHSFRLLDKALWRHAFAMMIERPDAPSSVRFSQNDDHLRVQIADLMRSLQAHGKARADLDPGDAGLCVFNLIDRFLHDVRDQRRHDLARLADVARPATRGD